MNDRIWTTAWCGGTMLAITISIALISIDNPWGWLLGALAIASFIADAIWGFWK